jgi:D-alanyl-D-alanine carboxypeptidase
MPERFVKEARTVAADAQDEARASGSSTIEAEHLLLALARDDASRAGDVLRASGLDHAAIRQALDEEYERSLTAIGVSLDALTPRTRPPIAGRPRWAPSGRAALERALEAARARGNRRIGSRHILLGVLAAEQGTVPRALRGVGAEPAELVAATNADMVRRSN